MLISLPVKILFHYQELQYQQCYIDKKLSYKIFTKTKKDCQYLGCYQSTCFLSRHFSIFMLLSKFKNPLFWVKITFSLQHIWCSLIHMFIIIIIIINSFSLSRVPIIFSENVFVTPTTVDIKNHIIINYSCHICKKTRISKDEKQKSEN